MTQLVPAQTSPIKAIECRFATYCKSKNDRSDIHVVKKKIHYEDGTTKNEVEIVPNYQRDFYVTKKGKRNYKDKREWSMIDDLDKFSSTQTQLVDKVSRALGKGWMQGGLRDLSADPYLYGSDITSSAIIKQSYKNLYPDMTTPYSVAVFDTETDVVHDTGEVIIATVSYKNKVFTACTKKFVAAFPDAIERVHRLAQEYLGEILQKRNIEIEFVIVDSEIDIIKACLAKAHEWQPDFMAVWNISFDMDKIIDACLRAGVNIEDIICDPSVPEQYRNFYFKKGPAFKKTASGKTMNFKPAQRWHSVHAPASFTWIDAMCVYRHVRMGEPEEPSYGLDALLKKNKIGGKLKFKEAEHVESQPLEWHKLMQSKFPCEYIVYNIYDCVSMEMLDEATLDCQLSLPMNAGCSDFANFNSQPRRRVDDLHWFCLKHGRVIGSTGSEMTTELDDETMDLSDWIVMLPAHLVADNGLRIVTENGELRTNIRVHVGDLDVAASYPNGECVFNVSKETTSKELINIEGVDEFTQRMGTINLSAGPVNCVEIAVNLFGMPTFDQWLDAFDATPLEEVEPAVYEPQKETA